MANGKTLMAIVGVETKRMVSTAWPFRLAARRRMPNKSRLSFSVSTNRRCPRVSGTACPHAREQRPAQLQLAMLQDLGYGRLRDMQHLGGALMVPTCMMA